MVLAEWHRMGDGASWMYVPSDEVPASCTAGIHSLVPSSVSRMDQAAPCQNISEH